MDNPKDDSYYLKKIITDLDFVIEQTHGKSEEEIEEDVLLMDSIMFRIIQIAENTGHLTNGFKEKASNVPWTAIKGMRNRIVHDYGGTKLAMVYDTVARWMPKMRVELIKAQKAN